MPNDNNIPRLLSIRDAAKALCISERTLYSLTQAGKIKVVRISPKAVRYDAADLSAFIEAMKGVQ
jgi:excisionase family DNA binding protein